MYNRHHFAFPDANALNKLDASALTRQSNNNYICQGCVWIELILLKLKTENWKNCSKIIFKCMNSDVGPIFNEKVAKKRFMGPMNSARDLLVWPKAIETCLSKKKKKQNADVDAVHGCTHT